MIENEHQYVITKNHLENFTKVLAKLKKQRTVDDKILHKIQINAIRAKIEDFKTEITEYQSKITS